MTWSASLCIFFFNDTATTEIYTLSLHDALPICIVNGEHRAARIAEDMLDSLVVQGSDHHFGSGHGLAHVTRSVGSFTCVSVRSEEHTSELQSRQYLVCRLLLEKKKQIPN